MRIMHNQSAHKLYTHTAIHTALYTHRLGLQIVFRYTKSLYGTQRMVDDEEQEKREESRRRKRGPGAPTSRCAQLQQAHVFQQQAHVVD